MTAKTENPVKRRRLARLNALEDESDHETDMEDHLLINNGTRGVRNPYLETINRSRLDFDFEKNCSISLTNVNIYCCLVCGKYLQGRGKTSHAFQHSITDNHHVFVNLNTTKFYVLPENQEITNDKELDDIAYQIKPTFTESAVKDLYKNTGMAYDLNGAEYRPGFVGINNFSNTSDYANVVIQALAHVNGLRDYLLQRPATEEGGFTDQFSLIVKKLWSSKLFKSHISVHALLEYIFNNSNGRFSIQHQADPKIALIWFLNKLSTELSTAGKRSLVQKVFQGKVSASEGKLAKFWLLSVDLPYYSLLKEGEGLKEIPQVSLGSLLNSKYANSITSAPPVLIFHINRFKNSDMKISSITGSERNPTVVRFSPVIDMSSCLKSAEGPVEYQLVANIVHELVPLVALENNDTDSHNWKVQLYDKTRNEWLMMHDLKVEKAERELLFLEESYIQFWEKI